MQQMFSMGISALVPSGRDVGFTHAEHVLRVVELLPDFRSIEKMPEPALVYFLELLKEHRGKILQDTSEIIFKSTSAVLQGRETSLSFDFEAFIPEALIEAQSDSLALLSRCRSAQALG